MSKEEMTSTKEAEVDQEVCISEEQLKEIRNMSGHTHEIFRRIGVLDADKLNLLQEFQMLEHQKKSFMEKVGEEHSLEMDKLDSYQIDLNTGKVLQRDMNDN